MNVNDDTIKGLVEGLKQFEVPIWQRQYTWDKTQHEQLWQDLLEQYRHLEEATPARTGHFFGSVVLSPRDVTATSVTHFLVIDGQQRLTTVMLLLCALRDVAAEQDAEAVDRYNNLYLLNQYADGNDRYRLFPTQQDRGAFLRWLRREPDNGSGDLISRAYRYYREQVERALAESDLELDRLARAALERLDIVEITTQTGDNVHRIFQSLNGTGVRLSQADLLRNHLFMLLSERGDTIYDQVWRPMEELIGVGNLEGLARLDLMRRGEMVAKDRVYEEHQKLLTPIALDEDAVEARVRDLALRAKFYKRLIDPSAESHPETRDRLHRLSRWGQTSYPVLMRAFDLRERQILNDEQVARAVSLIESFVVRRQLARIPTNALNRLFVQLVPRLPEDETFVDALHYELSRDRLYWPSDKGIKDALQRVPFFHVGRGKQRKMILEQLERSFGHPEIINFEEVELQVEHILPQTMSAEWREHLESLGQDPDDVHSRLVHTLGNLTLTAFNGELSNHPFERKSQIYGDSHLELNKALAESEVWGEEQILERAEVLADQVAEIWPAPIPGVTSESTDGFDWGPIETAIASIPAGRWTTYGDLAEFGGTAAVPVGQYVAQLPPGSNAYRVLTSNGSPSSNFDWGNADEDRDVRDVLAAEGVNFIDGRADPEQRMNTEELAALVEDPEDEISEDTGLTAAA